MPAPTVSVLVTTFNRRPLLQRALASVFKQDFGDFEIVIIDDCSQDDTQSVMATYKDRRIRYVRYAENVGGKHGDRAHLRKFVHEYAKGEFFVYLCDDDFWIPKDLLSRQVAAMRDHPSLALVIGGQVQIYPNELLSADESANRLANILNPNEAGLHLDGVPASAKIAFARGLLPAGFMSSDSYLDLFATDPAGRNLVAGATMFRRSAFVSAGVFEDMAGSRWQAGYELVAGAATAGDVFYLDEPCVASLVDLTSASFRGSQYQHLTDGLLSMDIAFRNGARSADAGKAARLLLHRQKMMHAIIFAYVMNKITYRFGGFSTHSIAELEAIFKPEIAGAQFGELIRRYEIPLWRGNEFLLLLSRLPAPVVGVVWYWLAAKLGGYWHQTAMGFPSEKNRLILQASVKHYLKTPSALAQLVLPVHNYRQFLNWIKKTGVAARTRAGALAAALRGKRGP